MSKFWTVRTGKSGERTEWSFANGVVGGCWDQIPDLTEVCDKEVLRVIVLRAQRRVTIPANKNPAGVEFERS